jgi:hypothetical protein
MSRCAGVGEEFFFPSFLVSDQVRSGHVIDGWMDGWMNARVFVCFLSNFEKERDKGKKKAVDFGV